MHGLVVLVERVGEIWINNCQIGVWYECYSAYLVLLYYLFVPVCFLVSFVACCYCYFPGSIKIINKN